MISPVLMIASLCDSFFSGLHHALELDVLWQEMPSLLYGSSAVALGSGFLVMALLLAIAYLNPTGALRRFLIGYAAPSAALTGFALLIVWRESGDATFAKIALGLALTTVPAFYRLRWDSVLQTLAGQRLVAVTMGASRQLVFRRVIFPQVIRPAAAIAGLTAMWAWGDFALSSVIAERTVTVGMQVQALIDSYRLDVATVLVWILILGGAVTYAFFIGVGRVLGSQSLS
jgi:thiamine transport system permease protein